MSREDLDKYFHRMSEFLFEEKSFSGQPVMLCVVYLCDDCHGGVISDSGTLKYPQVCRHCWPEGRTMKREELICSSSILGPKNTVMLRLLQLQSTFLF